MSSSYTREQKIIFSSLVELLLKGISYHTPHFPETFAATCLKLETLNDMELETTFDRYRSEVVDGGVDGILSIYKQEVAARQKEFNINIRFAEPDNLANEPKKTSWFRRLFRR